MGYLAFLFRINTFLHAMKATFDTNSSTGKKSYLKIPVKYEMLNQRNMAIIQEP